LADLQRLILAETFDLDVRDPLRSPAFPLEMEIGVLEVQEARRVVFQTVGQGPLQNPEMNLLFSEEPLGGVSDILCKPLFRI
jgi:hypothetical protein